MQIKLFAIIHYYRFARHKEAGFHYFIEIG